MTVSHVTDDDSEQSVPTFLLCNGAQEIINRPVFLSFLLRLNFPWNFSVGHLTIIS